MPNSLKYNNNNYEFNYIGRLRRGTNANVKLTKLHSCKHGRFKVVWTKKKITHSRSPPKPGSKLILLSTFSQLAPLAITLSLSLCFFPPFFKVRCACRFWRVHPPSAVRVRARARAEGSASSVVCATQSHLATGCLDAHVTGRVNAAHWRETRERERERRSQGHPSHPSPSPLQITRRPASRSHSSSQSQPVGRRTHTH